MYVCVCILQEYGFDLRRLTIVTGFSMAIITAWPIVTGHEGHSNCAVSTVRLTVFSVFCALLQRSAHSQKNPDRSRRTCGTISAVLPTPKLGQNRHAVPAKSFSQLKGALVSCLDRRQSLLPLLGAELSKVHNTLAVAPLVVVPCNNLHHIVTLHHNELLLQQF